MNEQERLNVHQWLSAIAADVIDQFTGRPATTAQPADGKPYDPADPWGLRAEWRALQPVLELLSLSHREVLRLRLCLGFSYVAIADRLGVPVGTVRSRLARARATAAAHLAAATYPHVVAFVPDGGPAVDGVATVPAPGSAPRAGRAARLRIGAQPDPEAPNTDDPMPSVA